jgi:DMSO/TMAO reductase YedYZ molybdopterin-dependent catalytic subunit
MRLALSDADRTPLATGAASGRLPAVNGAPCLVVLPGHRELDRVTWVDAIEVG